MKTMKRPLGWLYGASLSLLGLWMIGQILVVIQQKSEIRRWERAYGEATKKREALQREAKALQVHLERLQSPERLTRLAVEELGMKLPVPSQIIRLAPSSPEASALKYALRTESRTPKGSE